MSFPHVKEKVHHTLFLVEDTSHFFIKYMILTQKLYDINCIS